MLEEADWERPHLENTELQQHQPDPIDTLRTQYHQAAARCLALLDQAKQAGIESLAPGSLTNCIWALGQPARCYHTQLWKRVSDLNVTKQSETTMIEQRRLLEEIRCFELQHHQLLIQSDRLVMACQPIGHIQGDSHNHAG